METIVTNLTNINSSLDDSAFESAELQCQLRGHRNFVICGESVKSLIESVLKNFRIRADLKEAKVQITDILSKSGIISRRPNNALHQTYRGILAAAWMYFPSERLHEAMKVYKNKIVNGCSPELRRFLEFDLEKAMETQ